MIQDAVPAKLSALRPERHPSRLGRLGSLPTEIHHSTLNYIGFQSPSRLARQLEKQRSRGQPPIISTSDVACTKSPNSTSKDRSYQSLSSPLGLSGPSRMPLPFLLRLWRLSLPSYLRKSVLRMSCSESELMGNRSSPCQKVLRFDVESNPHYSCHAQQSWDVLYQRPGTNIRRGTQAC